LIVDVARLSGLERLHGETDPSVLDLGDPDGQMAPRGGIRYDLRVERVGHELLVRGSLAQSLDCLCSRCACAFVREAAEPEFTALYPIEEATEFIDLTPEVREAIILALPGYPVCRTDCRGLCPVCGRDLNKGRCACKPGVTGQWSALDQLDRL
jgi:uncharacterized protein